MVCHRSSYHKVMDTYLAHVVLSEGDETLYAVTFLETEQVVEDVAQLQFDTLSDLHLQYTFTVLVFTF